MNKHITLLIVVLFFCSISLSFAEDISLIEIETEFVVEIEDIKKFSLTDDFYLIGHEIFN